MQFDPNSLQNGGGSGLGLFISNAIMKRHSGGMIGIMPGGVETDPFDEDGVHLISSDSTMKGCAFFIEMDGLMTLGDTNDQLERDSKSSRVAKSSNEDHVTDVEPFTDNRRESDASEELLTRVLVVEDSKFNRKMMTKALSAYAQTVDLAEDGVEAVNAVTETISKNEPHFDVIFMDSLMPNMNGIEATKIIRKKLNFPNPIVAVTGNMLPEDVKEFEDAGAIAVLGKPLILDELERVLKGTSRQCSLS